MAAKPAILELFREVLACIACRAPLAVWGDGFICRGCNRTYPLIDGRLWVIRETVQARYERESQQGFQNRLINFLRRSPRLYHFLYWTMTPLMPSGLRATQAIRRLPPDARNIVNLGSGTRRIAPGVLNLDIMPYANVDVVADIGALPFRDGSLDLVISEVTLEHVAGIDRAVSEIARVLKPGGSVYVTVPFLYPYHESPNDYFRWTLSGLERQFVAFEPLGVGVFAGPMTTLIAFLMRFFALLGSFRSRALYTVFMYVFMVILMPLKLLDPLFRLFPMSEDIASVLYFWGRKR